MVDKISSKIRFSVFVKLSYSSRQTMCELKYDIFWSRNLIFDLFLLSKIFENASFNSPDLTTLEKKKSDIFENGQNIPQNGQMSMIDVHFCRHIVVFIDVM